MPIKTNVTSTTNLFLDDALQNFSVNTNESKEKGKEWDSTTLLKL